MIKNIIENITKGNDLSMEESKKLMLKIMSGELNNSELAAILIALKSKGESSEEIAGFAIAMREIGVKINCDIHNTIDVCGTGGDNSGSFNISTATAFVVAGAGVNVAKHGNRSISSKCGSADVLQNLEIKINLSPQQAEKALSSIGISFLFAPVYHPAMKFASGVRKELGVKTIFNLLGPLTNPAGVKKQLIGTYSSNAAEKMAGAAKYLKFENVCFVCNDDKFDEILLNGTTNVFELSNSELKKQYNLTSADFNFLPVDVSSIKGDDADTNAAIIYDVLTAKQKNGAYQTVIANSAFALYSAGYSNNLIECKSAAEESIISGRAFNKLKQLQEFSNSVQ